MNVSNHNYDPAFKGRCMCLLNGTYTLEVWYYQRYVTPEELCRDLFKSLEGLTYPDEASMLKALPDHLKNFCLNHEDCGAIDSFTLYTGRRGYPEARYLLNLQLRDYPTEG